nr:MAG TPA: hypothetical protein [Caudoviricetes sp.]
MLDFLNAVADTSGGWYTVEMTYGMPLLGPLNPDAPEIKEI